MKDPKSPSPNNTSAELETSPEQESDDSGLYLDPQEEEEDSSFEEADRTLYLTTDTNNTTGVDSQLEVSRDSRGDHNCEDGDYLQEYLYAHEDPVDIGDADEEPMEESQEESQEESLEESEEESLECLTLNDNDNSIKKNMSQELDQELFEIEEDDMIQRLHLEFVKTCNGIDPDAYDTPTKPVDTTDKEDTELYKDDNSYTQRNCWWCWNWGWNKTEE